MRLTPGAASPARLSRLRIPAAGERRFQVAVSESGKQARGGDRRPGEDSRSRWRSTQSRPAGRCDRGRTACSLQLGNLAGRDADSGADVDRRGRDIAFPYTSEVYQQTKDGTAIWTAQIWHLNLSRSGSNLIADSRVVWSMNVRWTLRPRSAALRSPPRCSALTARRSCASPAASLAQTAATLTGRRHTARWTVAWLAFSISAPGTARRCTSTTVPAGVGRRPAALRLRGRTLPGTAALVRGGPLELRDRAAGQPADFGVASHGCRYPVRAPPVSGTNVNFSSQRHLVAASR